MKNSLGREVPNSFTPYMEDSLTSFTPIKEKDKVVKTEFLDSIKECFDLLKLSDGMTLSFHHHLRNGDGVLNLVLKEIKERDLKDITIAASSIFPVHEEMCELIENGNITKIYTNYLSGPVAKTITSGKMKDLLIMSTHGGRPFLIESGKLKIDVAFIATPCVDKAGNGNGVEGKNACGTLGYAIADLKYASKVVLVTDTIKDKLEFVDLDRQYIDYVLKVDSIGEQKGIVSGTTRITRDPVGLIIARNTAKLIDELGLIKEGFSMQTGAGSISLAVTQYIEKLMIERQIKAFFALGGITSYYVKMLESGLIKNLYDVQCFDLEAVKSYKNNQNHIGISATEYAGPHNKEAFVNKLDFVILGATEIDVNFNVNVTTDSNGIIIGGSGGHFDTARGAKTTIITSQLLRTRLPIVKDEVTTITTLGKDVDIFVCERGIAINPKRTDLIEKLKDSTLNITTIDELLKKAHQITGIPKNVPHKDKIVGVVLASDGTVIDSIYQR